MGVGCGFAIAAALWCRDNYPSKRVIAVQGDSAFGFSGMEVETACRFSFFYSTNKQSIGVSQSAFLFSFSIQWWPNKEISIDKLKSVVVVNVEVCTFTLNVSIRISSFIVYLELCIPCDAALIISGLQLHKYSLLDSLTIRLLARQVKMLVI
jgi:hypothetical protein